MQRAFFIWALILPCFAKVLHNSDTLTLEALNGEVEFAINRLDRFLANQEGWEDGGLDQPLEEVTWKSLMSDLENLINTTVQMHIHKLDLKCFELNETYQSELEKLKSKEEDYLNMLSKQDFEDEELKNKVRECSDEIDKWKVNLTEAEKNVKFAADLVKILEATLNEIKNNISHQQDSTKKIELELQKLNSDSVLTSKRQADINAAILKIEEKQSQFMEEMGIEMMRQMKQGNDELKEENKFIKSSLEEIMAPIGELKELEKKLNRKAGELMEKLSNLKAQDEVATEEYGDPQEAIKQLRDEVLQQREEISRLKQSSASDDELRQVRDVIATIRASPSTRPEVAALEAKIAEARRSCVTGDDVRRLLHSSQDSKCSARVKHTPGRPSRLHIEIISAGKKNT